MRCKLGWMGAALVVASQAAAAAAGDIRRERAEVFADGSDRLLYREVHYVAPDRRGERWVLYSCPDGRAFARKRVSATGREAAPDFALVDGRDGYGEGVRSAPGERTAYVRERGRGESARSMQVPANGVIDAGFDAAVRQYWPELMRDRTLRWSFSVPSRQAFYAVRVQRTGSIDWQGIGAERLRMQLDTWFGFAVPDVELVYARDDQRLLEFRGTGNVRDANGRNPKVRIAFDPSAGAAPRQELEQARRAPLDGRCEF